MTRALAWIWPIGLAIAMFAARRATGQSALLVPEAAAVAAGMLVWRLPLFTHRPLATVGTVMLGAFGGVELARYVHAPQPLLIVVAALGILSGLAALGIPAIPALSARLLPVYLHITSGWYVLAVAATMLPVAVRAERRPHGPARRLHPTQAGRIALAFAPLLALGAVQPFAALPPLYVVAAEAALAQRSPSPLGLARRAVVLLAGYLAGIGLGSVAPGALAAPVAAGVALAAATTLATPLPPALAYALVPLLFPATDTTALLVLGSLGVVTAVLWPAALGWVLARPHEPTARIEALLLEQAERPDRLEEAE